MRRIICFVFLFIPLFAFGQQKPDPAPVGTDLVRSEMLVSTKWLADHLKDPNVVILHVADNLSDYKRGHIPGARFLAMKKFTTDNGPITVELPGVGSYSRHSANWASGTTRGWSSTRQTGSP